MWKQVDNVKRRRKTKKDKEIRLIKESLSDGPKDALLS